mmetsp:Transcript_29261/g.57447  ORF Transcript_29261/g.57447 Transcript_29261/m.57447 type:complete len:207 (+) Transcript_29261:895-1515(+)
MQTLEGSLHVPVKRGTRGSEVLGARRDEGKDVGKNRKARRGLNGGQRRPSFLPSLHALPLPSPPASLSLVHLSSFQVTIDCLSVSRTPLLPFVSSCLSTQTVRQRSRPNKLSLSVPVCPSTVWMAPSLQAVAALVIDETKRQVFASPSPSIHRSGSMGNNCWRASKQAGRHAESLSGWLCRRRGVTVQGRGGGQGDIEDTVEQTFK